MGRLEISGRRPSARTGLKALAGCTGLGLALALAPLPAGAEEGQGQVRSGPLDHARDTAEPKAKTLKPLALPRGPYGGGPYLQNGVLHAGGIGKVTVPHDRKHLQVLGKAKGGGWLVAAGRKKKRGTWEMAVHLLRAGKKPVKVPRTTTSFMDGSFTSYRVSRDGELLLTTTYDRGGSSLVVRRISDGKRVAGHYDGSFYRPTDAADGRILTYGLVSTDEEDRVVPVDWTLGVGKRELPGTTLWGGFIRQDVLFTGGDLKGGPTSLSNPGTPAWKAGFSPLHLSPNGKFVIGSSTRAQNKHAVLQVRRMDTGKVVKAFTYGPKVPRWSITNTGEQTAWFQDNDAFVFQMSSSKGAVLVRCRIKGGGCRRASDPGSNISTPYETFMW